jgi:hypothetical protein
MPPEGSCLIFDHRHNAKDAMEPHETKGRRLDSFMAGLEGQLWVQRYQQA